MKVRLYAHDGPPGPSRQDTCYTDVDQPDVRGRDGKVACREWRPFQTNVRANASYTIPWADVLVGAVFQYRPGAARSANLTVANTDVVWEAPSAHRQGTQFYTTGNNPASTQVVNLLETGDLYGEGLRMWDLKFSKNIRFAGKRVNLGVDVYNVFNTDAALGCVNTYTATRLADGTWVEDNPATPEREFNDWGRVTQVTTPRHMKLSIQFDF